jgi:hypothetical protein
VSVFDQSSGNAIKGSLMLSGINKSILAFRSQKFRDLVIHYIFDAMPMALRLTEKNYNAADRSISWEMITRLDGTKNVSLPKKIFLYNLSWDERFQLWQAKTVGEASNLRIDIQAEKQLLHQRKQGERSIQVKWTLGPETKLNFAGDTTIWIHNQKGPDFFAKKSKSDLEAEVKRLNSGDTNALIAGLDDFAKILTAPLGSAHIGARFGLPLLRGAPYGSKTTFIGLLAEVRSGALEGLRFNADLWPRVTDVFDGEEGEFAGSRYIVGWSFRFALPWLADSIDFAPAVGLWSFKMDVPVSLDGKNYLSGFDVKNALSFGVGIGLEWIAEKYLTRLWYNQDLGLSLGSAVDSSSVLTQRFGFDGMHRISVFKVSDFMMTSSVLGFVGLDMISLERSSTAAVTTGPVIGSVTIFQIYAGGGLSISW